ncbi:FGGY family carbohydrate kinase [Betaproteobacteria bacterium]|nr:FGGY family carbohydrate kinase [Betaproteobacteria bacterium]
MNTILLIDYGASRIKIALWDKKKDCLVKSLEVKSPSPTYSERGEVENDPFEYWQILKGVLTNLIEDKYSIESIWLCCEMHGAIFTDHKGNIFSKYIGWRDQRSIFIKKNKSSLFECLLANSEMFFEISGMNLKPGLPFVTLAALTAQGIIPKKVRIFTLADWILWCAGEKNAKINGTLAAATGLYDINNEKWSCSLLKVLGLENTQIIFPKVTNIREPIGTIHYMGQSIKVFGGLGDMQAAMYGATKDRDDSYGINIGTGSQIICNYSDEFHSYETRPGFFNKRKYTVFSHIPSGRVLSSFANFFDEIATSSNGQPFFWHRFYNLTTSEVMDANLNIDLNLFSNNRDQFEGGAIKNIRENNLNHSNFLSSLALSWLLQYVKIIENLDQQKKRNFIIVFGGLGRKVKFVPETLQILLNKEVKIFYPHTGEETLDGLLKLSHLENISTT